MTPANLGRLANPSKKATAHSILELFLESFWSSVAGKLQLRELTTHDSRHMKQWTIALELVLKSIRVDAGKALAGTSSCWA